MKGWRIMKHQPNNLHAIHFTDNFPKAILPSQMQTKSKSKKLNTQIISLRSITRKTKNLDTTLISNQAIKTSNTRIAKRATVNIEF